MGNLGDGVVPKHKINLVTLELSMVGTDFLSHASPLKRDLYQIKARAVIKSMRLSISSSNMGAPLTSLFEVGFSQLLRALDLPPPHQISLDQMKPVAAATRMAMMGHAFNTVIVTLALLVNGFSVLVLAWTAMSLGIAYHVASRAQRNAHLRQKTAQHKALSQRAINKAFTFGLILALPWGLLPVLFFDPTHYLTTMVIVALVAGMSASGAISLAPVYPAAFAYVLTTIVPTFFVLIFNAHVFEFALLAGVTLCYGVFLCSLIAVVARISIGASQNTAKLNHTLLRINQATRNIDEARTGLSAWKATNDLKGNALPEENTDTIVDTLNKSARKMLKQRSALQRSEKTLSSLLNTAMDGIISIDRSQVVLRTNSAAKAMFGIGASDTDPSTPSTLAEFLRQDSLQDVMLRLDQMRNENRYGDHSKLDGVLIEAVGRTRDGKEFPIEISAAVDAEFGNATLIIRDVSERKSSEAQLRVLMMEVNHRSRNLMAVLNSIMSMTASRAQNIDEFVEGFGKRLQCLLKSHEIIMRDDWTSSHIKALIDTQLSTHLPEYNERVEVSGPEIVLTPKAMQNLGLALHELATNAMKYGAFSVPEGTVKINWRTVGQGANKKLQLVWREEGGPEAKAPKQKGFGSVLLEKIFGSDLEGRSGLKYRTSGLTWQAQIGSAHFKLA